MAVKMMENIADNIEEIDEEFLVLRDLCLHPNIPSFHGLYLKLGCKREEDQLWIVMEVRLAELHRKSMSEIGRRSTYLNGNLNDHSCHNYANPSTRAALSFCIFPFSTSAAS